jgi:hypothetical protein
MNLKKQGHHPIIVKELIQYNHCIDCKSYNMVQYNGTSTQCENCGNIQSIMQPVHIRVKTNAKPAHKQGQFEQL